ncbi:MAG: TonB-dependent receptor domain-containing protein [Bacteroidota bacterium]
MNRFIDYSFLTEAKHQENIFSTHKLNKYMNNKKSFYFIIAVFTMIFSVQLSAQRPQGQRQGRSDIPISERPKIGTLTGTILDKQSGEPLMFASVVLNAKSDSTMVSGAITNEDGKFTMEELPPGLFFITVNFVGYPSQNFNNIRITFRENTVDMGIIEVEPMAKMLNEVTVEAARTLMETGLDRRVINVGQELTSIGGTGLELIENIPSVAVDFDGNISLRGSGNVTILIDGRPSTLTGLSGSEALEQIPAELIEKVEVITNPSAKYNPEGTSGIINVVLKKQKKPGYNGMISLNANSNLGYNGSVNVNYQIKKWNFFTNYSARLMNNEWFGNSFRATNPGLENENFMDQELNGEFNMNAHNIQAGVDYMFNEKNTLTLSGTYSNWNRNFDNITEYILYQDLIDPNSLFIMDNYNDMFHNSFNTQMNFRRTYDQKNRELIADVVFANRNIDRNEDFLQQFYENNFANPNGLENLERSNMIGENWSVSTQLDYIHPLNDKSKIETGYRVQIREMDSDFLFENFVSDNWEPNSKRSNHFIFNEQIYAAYAQYSTLLGNYSIQAGLRAEQSFIDGDLINEAKYFSKNYLNLFPTAHIRRNFENNQALQISYSRRINRPHNRNLNPFQRYNSEYDVLQGNPELDPELINSYEIGYTKFWNKTTLNPSIFYRNTNGMITRFRDVQNIDGRDVTITTYENLNQGISYGTELILTQKVSDWWTMNGTFSYFRNIIQGSDAQMEQENDNYSWSARFVSNMNIGKGWNMQITGFYRSPIIMLQGEMDEMYAANAGIRKNVWANKGTVSLNVNDIFNTLKFRMHNYGESFTMDMDRWRISRIINIGFTYRINEYDRKKEKRDRGSENDDYMIDFEDF